MKYRTVSILFTGFRNKINDHECELLRNILYIKQSACIHQVLKEKWNFTVHQVYVDLKKPMILFKKKSLVEF
jgi:hypothetical protein